MTTIATYRLNNGRLVYAKQTEQGLSPVRYANRTQAYKKQGELGAEWAVYRFLGRPFYVGLIPKGQFCNHEGDT